jgi:2-keto-4-pentenoate hydratase/2-oxohepta-3-ene-1,7-dioic acid hydratase in catechol pathway
VRLVSFSTADSAVRPGLAVDGTIVPLQGRSMAAVLEGLEPHVDLPGIPSGDPLAMTDVTFHAPFRPGVVVAAGPEPAGGDLRGHREFYLKSAHTVIGPNSAIPYHPGLGTLSYRGQLGLVLARTPRHTPAERILERVIAAVVSADVVSIDLLRPAWEGTMWHIRYGEGGSFDGSCPVGPELVTADELRLGELRLEDAAGDLPVDADAIAELLAYVSHWMALGPEVLVLTGGTHGPVFEREPSGEPVVTFGPAEPRLGPGDRVRVNSAIGSLDVPIAAAHGAS